jgi:hypothetical protein
MATSKRAPRSPAGGSRKPGRADLMRREILSEWRGADEAVDLDSRIHAARDFIDAILRSAGIADGIQEDELRAAWKELAGDFIARHTEPLTIKGGHLVLRVTQPAMRFHLDQMKPMLLDRIRGKLGKDRIHSVKFTLG